MPVEPGRVSEFALLRPAPHSLHLDGLTISHAAAVSDRVLSDASNSPTPKFGLTMFTSRHWSVPVDVRGTGRELAAMSGAARGPKPLPLSAISPMGQSSWSELSTGPGETRGA